MLGIYGLFVLFAFVMDTPQNIVEGLYRISTSRSILITDYIELGGIGATFVNSAIVGCASIFLMVRNGIKPNGAIIMAIWLTTGFALFGKNIFNMMPITFGVWLFAKYQKQPFMNYALVALLSASVSPVVSEITFLGAFSFPVGVLLGVLLGIFAGFVFSPISSHTVSMHMGYCLYNMGVAGGLIATFVVSVMRSLGVEIQPVTIWNSSYNFELAIFLYIISAILIVAGLYKAGILNTIWRMKRILKQSGRLVSDFYIVYKESVYVNMGLLCALSTTILLLIGADLNGASIGGIFAIAGFGSFGKHPRNVLPVIAGAILSTYFNRWDPTSPANTLAILFSTCLAPIAGQFGWLWGVIAGFIHVNMATNIGAINSGLNLYNNGFAGGLVAMLLVPVIMALRKDSEEDEV